MPYKDDEESHQQSFESQDTSSSTIMTQPSRQSFSSFLMPSHVHRMLNAYLEGDAGSVDSDSDNDSMNDGDEKRLLDGVLSKETMNRRQKGRTQADRNSDVEALRTSSSLQENTLRRRLAIPIVLFLLFIVLSAFFAGQSHISKTSNIFLGTKLPLTLQSTMDGTFSVQTESIDWLPEAGDGVYSYRQGNGDIMLHDLNTNETRTLVKGADVLDDMGFQLDYQSFQVSSDLRYILFGTDKDQLYRHSSRSNFHIHDLHSHNTQLLRGRDYPSRTAFAKWAPTGHQIAYVHGNDLYIANAATKLDASPAIRLTTNGNETIFNGVPDWVYEEEVFGQDYTTWWSPDGRKLAWISFDESEVKVYRYPIYNNDRFSPGANQYPEEREMRYPKPGTPNPQAHLYFFDLATYERTQNVNASISELTCSDALDIHNRIITEVAWVGDNDLIVKETDRAGSRERVAHFDLSRDVQSGEKAVGVVTRDTDYAALDGGWVETGQTIHSIDAFRKDGIQKDADVPPGYLDIVPDKAGFAHVALFSPAEAREPVFLTSGDWEIEGGIEGIDLKRKLIYFIAAKPSIERHLFSVPLPTTSQLASLRSIQDTPAAPTALSDTSQPGFHTASFSPQAGYYLLGQRSGLPWQRVHKIGDTSFDFPLTDNAKLNATLAKYVLPKTTFKNISITDKEESFTLNVAETVPPNLDISGRTKYPVLFRPYGGPTSQTVQHRFRLDFTHYLASTLGYIVVEVDNRGTGYRGRHFKSLLRKQLGLYEALDQISVAEQYAKLPYVDEERIGIQGWSYGGYLAAKVIERNSTVFNLGISVAPVTDWQYYDTIYTERYMGTLEENRQGYEKSAVVEMDGFQNADYLLMHGSGDDNVHYLNSAALLDRLTYAGVSRFQFRMFTDSAHSMGVRHAYQEVYGEIERFLLDKFGRPTRYKSSREE